MYEIDWVCEEQGGQEQSRKGLPSPLAAAAPNDHKSQNRRQNRGASDEQGAAENRQQVKPAASPRDSHKRDSKRKNRKTAAQQGRRGIGLLDDHTPHKSHPIAGPASGSVNPHGERM